MKNEASKTKAIGFDIGTSRIVTARQVDDEIQYNVQLNGFVGHSLLQDDRQNAGEGSRAARRGRRRDSGAWQRIGAVRRPARTKISAGP